MQLAAPSNTHARFQPSQQKEFDAAKARQNQIIRARIAFENKCK